MRPEPESIGRRLRRLRGARGLSQYELSAPGVSDTYIGRIETGERRPSVKAVRILAARLGVEADYLEFGDEGIKGNPTFRSMQRRIIRLERQRRHALKALAA